MKSLFDSLSIGNIIIKNRFVRSATCENAADELGNPSSKIYDFYEKLSNAEIGLIITGYARVIEEDRSVPRMLGIYNGATRCNMKSIA